MEVLLVGNTDFITKQWIQHAFPQDHVVIAEREGTVDGNDRLKSEGVVQCGYVKNDGERFMLTILTDNRSMDETMWVFERKDLP